MNKPVLHILCGLIVSGLTLSCQNKPSTPAPVQTVQTTGGLGKFEFQEDFYNFGTVQAGEVISYSFQFKNTGTGPLIISKVDVDCGCVEVHFPKEAINPGEKGYIEVSFNSAGEVGQQIKTLTIFANTEQKQKELHVGADVKSELINLN